MNAPLWYCTRCKRIVQHSEEMGEFIAGKCACDASPSPWVNVDEHWQGLAACFRPGGGALPKSLELARNLLPGAASVSCDIAWDLFAYLDGAMVRTAEHAAEVRRLTTLLNTPEIEEFSKAVTLEAAHQRERWGSEHDDAKGPFDWFWLVGYLAQKAASAAVAGDRDKALHHTVSTAAALANWHIALTGTDTSMRPGIDPPEGVAAP